jgi:hypothetical protein
MKARVSSILRGFNSISLALVCVARSGPCADMQLWIEIPPGEKPSAFAS